MINRRKFIKNSSLTGLAFLGISGIVNAAMPNFKGSKAIKLMPNDKILFQGDSITDSGRDKDREGFNDPAILGEGYAFLAAADLLHQHPAKNLKIYNKGISGNKVYQLAERWEKEAIALEPDILSILIGVNDYWHRHNGNYDGTVEVYLEDYMKLMEMTKKQLPNVKLVICEPFAVKGVKAVDETWFPHFDGYRKAAREVADANNAVFVPLQKVFDEAEKSASGSYWTTDGVHPTLAGSKLMALAWQKAVK